jgi:hypothetical protein
MESNPQNVVAQSKTVSKHVQYMRAFCEWLQFCKRGSKMA